MFCHFIDPIVVSDVLKRTSMLEKHASKSFWDRVVETN